tara:strand:- start:297 stop:935 length:639 start_codon:yes stop_codon:yes gene_type:complete
METLTRIITEYPEQNVSIVKPESLQRGQGLLIRPQKRIQSNVPRVPLENFHSFCKTNAVFAILDIGHWMKRAVPIVSPALPEKNQPIHLRINANRVRRANFQSLRAINVLIVQRESIPTQKILYGVTCATPVNIHLLQVMAVPRLIHMGREQAANGATPERGRPYLPVTSAMIVPLVNTLERGWNSVQIARRGRCPAPGKAILAKNAQSESM